MGWAIIFCSEIDDKAAVVLTFGGLESIVHMQKVGGGLGSAVVE